MAVQSLFTALKQKQVYGFVVKFATLDSRVLAHARSTLGARGQDSATAAVALPTYISTPDAYTGGIHLQKTGICSLKVILQLCTLAVTCLRKGRTHCVGAQGGHSTTSSPRSTTEVWSTRPRTWQLVWRQHGDNMATTHPQSVHPRLD